MLKVMHKMEPTALFSIHGVHTNFTRVVYSED